MKNIAHHRELRENAWGSLCD